MKKVALFASTLCMLLIVISCTDQQAANTHQHEDGAVHSDHAPDTVKPQQQEFVLGDSTGANTTTKDSVHTHKDGKKHSH
jgi:hypothetical protein